MRITRTLFTCLTLSLSLVASAQTFEQLTFLRFNTAPASVRSQAMGSISGDDGATNPAALASLKTAQFAIAGSQVSYELADIAYLEPNYVVSRMRDLDRSGLSHVMVSVPVRSFVVGAWYRSEPRVEGLRPLVHGGIGPWAPSECVSEPCMMYVFGAESPALERIDDRYGAAVAWERGPVAFGIGAELHELDERVDMLRNRFSIAPALNDRVVRRVHGRELVPNAGIRWSVTPRVAVAAAYNGAASFSQTTSACYAQGQGCGSELVVLAETDQKTVAAYRASVSVRPVERLNLVLEAVRRNYSDVDSYDRTLTGDHVRALPYQDVTELHAGGEFRVNRLALRAGWWRDPARIANAAFPGYALGNRADHVTYGAGFDFGGGRIDVAFDDPDDEVLRRASIGITLGVPSLQLR